MKPEEMLYSAVVKKRIEMQVSSHNISITRLAERYFKHLGFKTAGNARDHLYTIKRGYLYGSTSMSAITEENLTILSRACYAVGFPEDDEAVMEIRGIDERFVYPPNNGVSYERIKRRITSDNRRVSPSRIGPYYRKAFALASR